MKMSVFLNCNGEWSAFVELFANQQKDLHNTKCLSHVVGCIKPGLCLLELFFMFMFSLLLTSKLDSMQAFFYVLKVLSRKLFDNNAQQSVSKDRCLKRRI